MDNKNLKTPLYEHHIKSGAKMVSFSGYDMPIQYEGIKAEHLHTRASCGVFDVSHMGQFLIKGKRAAEELGKLTPYNFSKLPVHKCRYTVFCTPEGGIIDDLIVTKLADDAFYLVVNGATLEGDREWLWKNLPNDVTLEDMTEFGLIAVQGPKAEEAMHLIFDEIEFSILKKMNYVDAVFEGHPCRVTRTGYTGEDGFEISIANDMIPALWEDLMAKPDVKPIGLGARDSLRLEVGFPLYGHDMDHNTTPFEASLGWIVDKTHDGYIGCELIEGQRNQGIPRKRVGLTILDKGIAREGAVIFSENGEEIGKVTSGGFSPTLDRAVAMGYVSTSSSSTDTPVLIDVRGRKLKAKVSPLNHLK
ncbi:MAG: glycine cleavage system aminomethyltransferase GcvT [Alphaproteobacteria bacterium]|nr:glycine cleavage system aminomethyltransferase GcvT [Alphaproteobacteria bacterium]